MFAKGIVPKLRFKDESGMDFPVYKLRTLESLGNVERGKFSVRPRNDPRYFGGEIPFIQTGDIVFAKLFLDRFNQTINEEGLKVSRLFPANTILITIAANIGDTTITKFDVACTDSVVAIQPFANVANCVWLKFALDTKKDELDSKATQNAQKNINLQVLRPLEFHAPEYDEQTKIANFLTAVDSKISQLTKKHELLTHYKKGVMQKIFNRELRFKDDEGREFGEWEEMKFSDLGTIVTGKTPSTSDESLWNGDILFITPTDIGEEKYQISSARTVRKKEKMNVLPTHSIMFTCIASIGKMALSIKPCITNQQINSLIPSNSHYGEFIYYAILNMVDFIKSTQSTTTLPIINKTDFSKFLVDIPSYKEQVKIANFLIAIDDKIANVKSQLEAAKEYKQGLLQQMFV